LTVLPRIEPLPDLLIRPIVDLSLAEDLGRAGDITGLACIDPDARLSVVYASRQDGRVSGLASARLALAALDPTARFEVLTPDGVDATPPTSSDGMALNGCSACSLRRPILRMVGR
jgi:nicotinate-nucleotide pyrophosphorylase (carboxylating)